MSEQNSILDKVLASKQMQEASQFIPAEFVLKLFKNLNTKEREILTKRFGLDGENTQTLEEVGKNYEITRERIRQIQMTAIKKLKELKELEEEIKDIESLVNRLLEGYGGVMEESHLVEKLLSYSESNKENRQAVLFILEHLLEDKIEKVSNKEHFLPGWKMNILPQNKIEEALLVLYEIIKKENKLLTIDKLIEKFSQYDFYKNNQEEFNNKNLEKVVESYLRLSRKIDQNIMDEWGLNSWTTIKPKRMSDKVYMILRKTSKPLHFKEIADLINKSNFDSKIAHPATIHNELILNDKFVLIGRGIYALKEWGYKEGTVADVIVDLLEKTPSPLTKQEIIDKVLKTRIVKNSTINLALTDKSKFKKLSDNTYSLVK